MASAKELHLVSFDSESQAPFDYQEYAEDSELNAFLEKEDLLSLRSGLSFLNINLKYLHYVETEQLNQLCDKLQLKIGSATRLQFTRAVIKLQSEYKETKQRKKLIEREEKKQQYIDDESKTVHALDPTALQETKSGQHVYGNTPSPRPKGYDYLIKCILLGDSDVGKSCIMVRYFDDVWKESRMTTVGIDYRVKMIELGDYIIKYQIWDTAGQEKYRTIISAYYRGIDAVLLCYDIMNRESFDNIRIWIETLQQQGVENENVFMMLCGTKLDLICDDDDREITKEEGQELADEYGMKSCEVSSKSGHGVASLFLTTASYAILNRKKKMELIDKSRSITQEKIDTMQQEKEKIEIEEIEKGKTGTDKFVKKKCCKFYI